VVVAVAVLSFAALAVVAAALSGSWLVATVAAALAVVLGGVATRITYTEVADTRLEWARDRAEQARGYRAITEARTAEQAIFVADATGRLTRQDAAIARLERRLTEAAAEVAEARAEIDAERARSTELTARLVDAEKRASVGALRVTELEQELDVVLAEWRSGQQPQQRKHA